MLSDNKKNTTKNYNLVIFLLILLLGAVVRLYALDSVPGGLNQDEASMGYDSFALLHYGVDRNNSHNPVHMIAWGSGQNALQAYATMPFIAAFDLNVLSIRLVPALFGVLCLVLVYFAGALIAGRTYGALAMFIVAISPWHIVLSRWALESNFLPGVILIATTLLMLAQKHRRMLFFPFAFFALSLYAYSTAYAFVPIFFVGYAVYAFYHRIFSIKEWVVACLTFGVLAAPIFLFVIVNFLKLDTITVANFTIPRMPGEARYTHMTSFFGHEFWRDIWGNVRRVFDILFVSYNDRETQSSVKDIGILYAWSIPFFFLGLIFIIRDFLKDKKPSLLFPVLLWFFGAFIVATLTSPAVHRMNLIHFPMILIVAYGLRILWMNYKILGVIALVIYGALFVRFEKVYFTDYADEVGAFFFEGYADAVGYVYAHAQPTETLYLSDYLNQPYIQVLFATKYDPHEYIKTVQIPNPTDPFQIVRKFGRFDFGLDKLDPSKINVAVAKNEELSRFHQQDFIVKRFKHFTALFRRDFYRLNAEGNPVYSRSNFDFSNTIRLLNDNDLITIGLPEGKSKVVQVTVRDFYLVNKVKTVDFRVENGLLKLSASDLFVGLNELTINSQIDKGDINTDTTAVFFRASPNHVQMDLDKLTGEQMFGRLEKNRAYEGSPLKSDALVIPWGFGVHADSHYQYITDGSFEKLQVSYGLSEASGNCGDGVIFEITADNDKILLSDDIPRGEMRRIVLPIQSMRKIEFKTFMKSNTQCDHANWMAPIFVR